MRGGITCAVREIEYCWIPMPDGVRLSARLWLPEEAGPVPAILETIPYRKRDMVRARDERNHPVFARAGYACVRVDMRGSGDSEGVMPDMYTQAEQDDAVDVIAWIARQDWCDGSVGMMGTSWGGTASLQAAARQPEALKAVIAVCATDNRFDDDIHHMGGRVLTDTVEWGAALPAILALPPDPDTVGAGWREMWRARLEAAAFPLNNWVAHRTRDAYWRNGSVSETPGAIRCPVLAVGGWTDRYSNTVMNLLADNPESCWGVVGPWGHHYPDVGCPGPAMNFQRVALDWWDRWLRGIPNGAEDAPRLRVWMRSYDPPGNFRRESTGRWIAESVWPAPSVSHLRFALAESGRLTQGSPKTGSVAIPFSLRTGLASGDTGYFGRIGGLPLDQEKDDAESLVFETPPLDAPLDLLGRARLTLRIPGPVREQMIAARLGDLGPAGVQRVTYGIRDLTLDDALSGPRDGGKPVTLTFPNAAYRFEVGHRIRLSLSTGYWPQVWPAADRQAITIDLGASVLCLPIRAVRNDSDDLRANQLPGREPAIVDEADGPSRSIKEDASGRCEVAWRQSPLRTEFPDIGIAISAETRAVHSIDRHDPRNAATEFEHRLVLDRKDGTFTAIGRASLQRSEKGYVPEGSLTVLENGTEIFRRDWPDRSARDADPSNAAIAEGAKS